MRKIDRVYHCFFSLAKDVATTTNQQHQQQQHQYARTTAKTYNGHKTKSLTNSPLNQKGVYSYLNPVYESGPKLKSKCRKKSRTTTGKHERLVSDSTRLNPRLINWLHFSHLCFASFSYTFSFCLLL